MAHRSKWVSTFTLALLALTVLACNLGDRLKPKRVVRQCFKAQPGASTQERYLLTSPEGGFSVTLPTGFTTVIPPEPIKPGYEYAGTSYYSYNFPCHCRINFTAISATGMSEPSDDEVFES